MGSKKWARMLHAMLKAWAEIPLYERGVCVYVGYECEKQEW